MFNLYIYIFFNNYNENRRLNNESGNIVTKKKLIEKWNELLKKNTYIQ